MKKKKDPCPNCNGWNEVETLIPCPNCKANGYNELIELRELAKWVHRNFESRSRPSVEGLVYLNRVLKSQGKDTL